MPRLTVDRDVRRHRSFSKVLHELRDVIGRVRAEREPTTLRLRLSIDASPVSRSVAWLTVPPTVSP
ncbi:hypothetical protein ACVWXN_006836 [Bradyrhizobium sp. i1.4.4]